MPTDTPSAGRRIRWDRWLLALYVASVIVIAIQKGFFTPDNNFAIFRASFGNLVAGRDLYAPHPDQYLDLYKYSPTFAASWITGHGVSSRSSHSAAAGRMTSLANWCTQSRTSITSSLSSSEKVMFGS